MDTHTEMCRKAVEVQELWEPKIGDWTDCGVITNIINQDSIIVYYDRSGHFPEYGLDELTWIPRQDQLQGMIATPTVPQFLNWIDRLTLFYRYIKKHKPEHINSLEQAWLAFVMHEKYDKKWDGKDWG